MAETYLDRLVTLRDRLAGLLESADERAAPALSKEYRSVLVELERLGVREASSVDDLSARRADRLAKAKGAESPPARKRGGRAGGDRPS